MADDEFGKACTFAGDRVMGGCGECDEDAVSASMFLSARARFAGSTMREAAPPKRPRTFP
jgi:hypothetical protein